MGRPRLRWDEIPLGAGIRRHARDRTRNRTARRADPAFAVRRQHGQSARDLLGRRSGGLRSRQDRPAARAPSDVSRARQYHARRDAVARPHRDPHLGTRRRPDQGLRLGGLRRRGRRGAAQSHRPQRDGHAARRRSRHRMARERRSRADDRPGRIRAQGPLRRGLVAPARERRNDERRGRHLRLPAQCRRIGSDPPRRGARRFHRHRRGQYLRGDGGGGAPGAADDPRAAPRAAAGQDRRHRLRGADRAADFRRHGRGRSRARQRGKARRRRAGRKRAPRSMSAARRRRSSTTSWR